MDPPARTHDEPDPRRPSTRRPLLVIGLVTLVLCVVFGVTTLRSRLQYRSYKEQTLDAGPMPWQREALSVGQCVEYSTQWAMECPGVESWCGNEAPVLTRRCLEAADRREYCATVADEVGSTRFGYGECEAMRDSVEGRYAKRSHKKFCASSFRAVASYCAEQSSK